MDFNKPYFLSFFLKNHMQNFQIELKNQYFY